MLASLRFHRHFDTILITVLLAASQGCAEKKAGTTIDWNSPQMHAIEKEWQALRDAYEKDTQGKRQYVELTRSVDRLLRMRLSGQNLRQLVASAEMVPILADDRSHYVNDVLAFMVKAFVESGDRESLGSLLSKHCPSQIDWPETIEFYLAFRGWKLKDPILILGEAYARCQVPETSHTLAASLRRGFAGLGIRGKDDMEFVNNAMRWYRNEKGHLIVNAKYTMNELRGNTTILDTSHAENTGTEDSLRQVREPLFKTNTVLRGAPKNLGEDPDR